MNSFLPAIALTATTAVLATASAQAGTVYSLNGNGGLALSHTITHSDVEITATATSYNPGNGTTHESYVGQYSGGLGVTNNVTVYQSSNGSSWMSSLDNSHTVDGRGWDDTVWLSFDKPFQLLTAVFTYVAHNYEDVRVVDENGNTLGDYDLSAIGNYGVAHLDLSGLNFTGTKIGFTAYGNGDSWKLKSIKGHVVPTPSAAAAGLFGLTAVAARRRRKAVEVVETVETD